MGIAFFQGPDLFTDKLGGGSYPPSNNSLHFHSCWRKSIHQGKLWAGASGFAGHSVMCLPNWFWCQDMKASHSLAVWWASSPKSPFVICFKRKMDFGFPVPFEPTPNKGVSPEIRQGSKANQRKPHCVPHPPRRASPGGFRFVSWVFAFFLWVGQGGLMGCWAVGLLSCWAGFRLLGCGALTSFFGWGKGGEGVF